MKPIKQLSFLVVLLLSILTSCTMEKRVHRSGYHIDWNNSRHNRQTLASNDNDKTVSDIPEIVTVETSEADAVHTTDNSQSASSADYTASTDKQQIIIAPEQKGNLLLPNSKVNVRNNANKSEPFFETEPVQGTKSIKTPPDDSRVSGVAVAGFIFSLVGLFIFAVVFGPIAVILGIIALKRINLDPLHWKGRGMAIAAIIIGLIDFILGLYIISML